MRKTSKLIYWGSFIIIVFLGFIAGAFFSAGYWLQSGGDSPEPSEAIVVLSGNYSRSFYAANLYREGYAPKVYISRPFREHTVKMLEDIGVILPREEEISHQILIKKGVPDKNIYIFGHSSLSTIEEAETLNRIFKGGKCSLLIVTSPVHIRRSRMIFNDILKNCELKIVGTPYEPFPKKWWTNQDSARNVMLEIAKIVFYKMGGRFRSDQHLP